MWTCRSSTCQDSVATGKEAWLVHARYKATSDLHIKYKNIECCFSNKNGKENLQFGQWTCWGDMLRYPMSLMSCGHIMSMLKLFIAPRAVQDPFLSARQLANWVKSITGHEARDRGIHKSCGLRGYGYPWENQLQEHWLLDVVGIFGSVVLGKG